jgi:hypothetical protein
VSSKLRVRLSGRQVVLAAGCLLLAAACSGFEPRGTSGSAQRNEQSPSPSSTAQSTTVRRTLDFEADRLRGQQLYSVDYGDSESSVGYIPPCRACADPCPCTVPLQPSSFDIDSQGDLWVLDTAKQRVAKFDSASIYASSWRQRGIGLRSTDLRVDDSRGVVLWQDRSFFSRLAIQEGGSRRAVRIHHDGEPQQGGNEFLLAAEHAYLNVFVEETLGDEEERALKVNLSDGSGEISQGRPFLDGWLLLRLYEGPRLIPLAVESSQHNWEVTIRFQLRHGANGESRRAPGHISWETEVSEDGVIHLLIAASIERPGLQGYWYLQVAPDGSVGQPIPLAGPTRRDDQQVRRLTLAPKGDPHFMWAMKKRVIVETLPSQ